MESVINSVIQQAPQLQQRSSRFQLLDVLNSKLGLAVITALATFTLSAAFEPPFLLYRNPDPIIEPSISYTRSAGISLVAAFLVLLLPTVSRGK